MVGTKKMVKIDIILNHRYSASFQSLIKPKRFGMHEAPAPAHTLGNRQAHD
jgi:hypothetical protein